MNRLLDQTANALLKNSSLFYNNVSYAANLTNNLGPDGSLCGQPDVGLLFYFSMGLLTVIIGFPCNLTVLWMLARRKVEASTCDVYVGSMAVLDGTYCVLLPIDTTNTLFIDNSPLQQTMMFFMILIEVTSPFFLCCMCIDRYIAVLHPLVYVQLRDTAGLRLAVTVAVWVIGIINSSTAFMNDYEYNYYISLSLFVITFIVTLFCSIALLLALRQTGPGRNEIHPVKQRAFRLVLLVIILVLVCLLPNSVIYVSLNLFTVVQLQCYLLPISKTLFVHRICLQPLLYLTEAGKLPCCRKSFKH